MVKHIVICDRCGKEEKLRVITCYVGTYYAEPSGWGEDGKYDRLCPKCFKEYKKHMDKFV
jgi:hypothetical protein